ncbi:MAG: hypothetical protein RKL24_08615 [Defluviicoccus sp.]|nr:hypothetical protein [Defluviicoccus sp.]
MMGIRPLVPGSHRVAVAVLGWGLVVLVTLRALLTIDPYFDTFAYHLPFAARLAGVCDEACFRMTDYGEALFAGFPKLFHRLQALFWRATGAPQALDLLTVAALVLYALFLRRSFAVPAGWTLLALLAVPLIQIHVSSSYIDLPLNLAAAGVILNLLILAQAPERFGTFRLLASLACLVLVANSKPQMQVVAGALGLALFAACALLMLRGHRIGPFDPKRARGWLGMIAFFAAAGALVAASAIANAIMFANPFYPVEIPALGLAGPVRALDAGWDSLAAAWATVPAPLRWLASVLEVDAYGYREVPWTFDQAYCASAASWRECWRQPSLSFRMGGYFVTYVLFLAAFFLWQCRACVPVARRSLLWTVALVTLLTAVLPHAHELRYYSFWMILLVSVCLIAVFDPRAQMAGRTDAARSRLLGAGCTLALVSVVLMTGGRYLTPTGPSLSSLTNTLGIDRRIAAVADGSVLCVGDQWAPFAFLFAPPFHPGRSDSVRNGTGSEACTAVVAPPP